MPRQAGEAEGLPRLSPELQPWEEVEAEGVPRLLQGIAGQQAASQITTLSLGGVVVGASAVAACEWIINAFIVYLVVITIWISPWL